MVFVNFGLTDVSSLKRCSLGKCMVFVNLGLTDVSSLKRCRLERVKCMVFVNLRPCRCIP